VGRVLDVRYTLSPKIAMSLTNKAYLGFIRKHLGNYNTCSPGGNNKKIWTHRKSTELIFIMPYVLLFIFRFTG
jgi:hypothetical protein